MKRKYILFFRIGFFFLTVMLLVACKKTDLTFYNYENSLKDFNGTALDYLRSQQGVYDSLLTVLERLPDISDSIENKDITLFAVTNRSFEIAIASLNEVRSKTNRAPIYLATANLAQLDTMICRYIFPEKLTTADFENYVDGLLVNSLKYKYPMHISYSKADASGFIGGGASIITFTDPKNSIFVRYWQSTPTNAVNIRTDNAIINVVAPGHDFGFGDFVTRINH